MPSDKPRFVPIRVDDESIDWLYVVGYRRGATDDGDPPPWRMRADVPVPLDDQLTRDIESAVLALEDDAKELHARAREAAQKGHHPAARTLGKRVARVHGQAARLRAAFSLDQEDE